ncbi:MAG: 3-oxoacyl-ACP synthase III family protein, partial [Planctomycetota bacterium]
MRATPNPHVRISGTGSYLPERVVDNLALRDFITGYDETHSGPFHHWVDQMTHVHERRYCDRETRSSELAAVASRRALDAAGVDAADLGMIIYASFTLSQTLPGDHCLLGEAIGVKSAPTFNLMAACAGSIYALGLAYGMVASGVYEHVLVVGTETISKILNYADPLTAIIFGDGAGAAVVSRGSGNDGRGMLPPLLRFQYSATNIHLGNSNIPVDVGYFPDRELQPGVPLVEQALIEMEGGPSVLRHAINQMVSCTVNCL